MYIYVLYTYIYYLFSTVFRYRENFILDEKQNKQKSAL